ncbi:MAG: OmpA family protein [Acidobacteria bacterium]|nr:OmpA family protein [Acidobacteriota bacterium]
MFRRIAVAWGLTLAVAAAASAQPGTSGTSTAGNSSAAQTGDASVTTDTRPATTTFSGDTGLWFVPTAEVLAHGKWSASGYRRGTNFVQGFTNVGDFAGTFAAGLGNRAEVFGSFLFDTRVERDLRPIFISDPKAGGIVDRYPRANAGWSGNNVGDLYVGLKYNLLSQSRNAPAALAARGTVKLPTGKEEKGVSTGKADVAVDVIASSELAKKVELSGFAGYEWRGQPSGFDIPSGAFRWGAGAGFPSRSPLRGVFELNGFVPNGDTATITGSPVIGTDLSIAPTVSNIEKITRATAALTWQHRSGFFVGGGVSWNVPTLNRNNYRTDEGATGDFVDWQVRIGYHPGVRVYVPPPPPAPPPPAPVAPQNRPPTVQAQCDPCTVEVGKTSTLTANGADPDGDTLTYRWSVPSGTLANPSDRQTQWTAPQQEGPVQATVTVNDGKGGTASANVTIQVTKPPVKNYTFEDVHFDFDRYTLRPEATRVLDEAVAALRDDPNLRIEVEGHTCNIGTAEYNLALGDRRANAVRDYLVSRGVTADRLRTISYGEERPKYDNSREETRRLNRRAALTVNVR